MDFSELGYLPRGVTYDAGFHAMNDTVLVKVSCFFWYHSVQYVPRSTQLGNIFIAVGIFFCTKIHCRESLCTTCRQSLPVASRGIKNEERDNSSATSTSPRWAATEHILIPRSQTPPHACIIICDISFESPRGNDNG